MSRNALARDVHRVLDDGAIPHAVIGATALILHGLARNTLDIDFLVTDLRCLQSTTWSALPTGTQHEVFRGDFDDPLAGAVRFRRQAERPVDVVVGKLRIDREAVARAESRPLFGVEVRVVTIADAILLKLAAGGPGDLWDIERLLALRADREALVSQVEASLDILPGDAAALWQKIPSRR